MRYVIGSSITILAVLVLQLGCQQDGGTLSSPSNQTSDVKNRRAAAEVTVGGKTWKIDPNRSYRATGVWINPKPRPLTDTERARLITVQAEIETLSTRLEQLSNEADYLERIETPDISIHYSFGMPPHKSDGDIIDLGEFPMKLENPNSVPTDYRNKP